jgi:hypothetical protein
MSKLIAPFEYIEAVMRGWPDIGNGPLEAPLSADERAVIDEMYLERWQPWCATGQIAYMRKLPKNPP